MARVRVSAWGEHPAAARPPPGDRAAGTGAGSERRLVVAGGSATRGRGRAPRVVVGAGRGVPRAGTALAAAATAATAAGHLVDLRRGVAQRRADLVDLQLNDGALLALPGLERPLPQPARHHDPHAAG